MHSTTSTSGSCVTNIWFIGLAAWLTATWAILCAVGFAAVGSATIPTYSYDYRTTSLPVLIPQNIELTAYMFSFCITNPPEYGYSYNPSTPSRNSYGQIGPSITVCYPFSAENKDFFTTQASIVDGATFNGGKTSNVQYSEIQAAQAFYIMAIVTLSVSVVLAWLLAFTPQSRPTKMTGVVLSGLCVFTFLCVIISLGTATHVFTQAKSQFDGYPSTSPYIYQGGTTQPPIKTSASVTVSAALPLLGIMILLSLLSTTLSVFVAIIKPRQPGVGVQRI